MAYELYQSRYKGFEIDAQLDKVTENATKINALSTSYDANKVLMPDTSTLPSYLANHTFDIDVSGYPGQILEKKGDGYYVPETDLSAYDTSADVDSKLANYDKSTVVDSKIAAAAYTLPPATDTTLGGVKPDGTTITVDSDGTLHGASAIDNLDDIGDVNISGATDGQALIYDATNDEWIPGNAGGGGGTTVIANPTLVGTEDNLESIQIGNDKFKVDTTIVNSGMHIHTDGFDSPDYDRVLTTITTAGASYTATEDCWLIGNITKSSIDTSECQVLIDGNIIGTSFVWTGAGESASVETIFVPVKINSIITTRNSVGEYNLTVYANKSETNIESQLATDAHVENNQDVAVGTIIPFFGTTAPAHYLACDGSVYNISAYPNLAEFIKDEFGSYNYFGGNGTTTFGVPNLRGEFLRGTGTNIHTDQGNGSNVGKHQNATEHIMLQSDATNTFIVKPTSAAYIGETNTDSYIGNSNTSRSDKILSNSTNTWTGSGLYYKYTSRPTNTSVLWCIKAEVTYYLVNQIENATIATMDVYSEDEKCIGCWTNGKPLYRKVIRCDTAGLKGQNGGSKTLTGITDTDFVNIKHLVWFDTIDNRWQSEFRYTPSWGIFTEVKTFNPDNGELYLSTSTTNTVDWSDRLDPLFAILEYTKTTDAPNSFRIDMLSNVQDLVLTATEVQSTIDSIVV